MEASFPGNVFAKGAVHELISNYREEATCTSGFICVVLGKLIQNKGYCLWISTVPRRSIFPSALKGFGIDPERILFVDAGKTKDTLWAIEEALKCDVLMAVVGEISELNFNDSRRLQLAVEKSHVTGFIHRFRPKTENAVACVSRWKIKPVASSLSNAPGVGFSRWDVELLKVRNGKTGKWQVQWSPKGLEYILPEQIIIHDIDERQIG
jgi:protein ImuA